MGFVRIALTGPQEAATVETRVGLREFIREISNYAFFMRQMQIAQDCCDGGEVAVFEDRGLSVAILAGSG